MTQTAIGTRQIIVLNPVQKTHLVEAIVLTGITPRRYIKIKIRTEEFGEVETIVWETHQKALFNEIFKHIDGLDWYDFPRIINIKLYGIVVTHDLPRYSPVT